MRLLLPSAVLFALLAFPPALPAQETPGGAAPPAGGTGAGSPAGAVPAEAAGAEESAPSGDAGVFPVALVLEAAEFAGDGNKAWRPDWPLELPPDAFKVLVGEITRAVVEAGGYSLSFRFGPGGRAEEFPCTVAGRLAQVSLGYNADGEIRELSITFPFPERQNLSGASGDTPSAPGTARAGNPQQGNPQPGEDAVSGAPSPEDLPWKLEFLEYEDSYPSLIRVSRGNAWYFAALSRGAGGIMETWYDMHGNALKAYGFRLIEINGALRIREVLDYTDSGGSGNAEYDYGSRGFITGSSSPGGFFRVLYFQEHLPRYWERLPALLPAGEGAAFSGTAGNFRLQWDKPGFLVRVNSLEENAADAFVDWRYGYTLDGKGNWIERRETRMLRFSGLLVPSPGVTVRRVLEYSGE